MSEKSIIVIGAGIAGLSAGCYGQMNGFKTEIFELHDLPGGLCTAWDRKGYLIDGCIHYLFGTAPGEPFHQLWVELGALKDTKIIHHEELMRVVDGEGRTFAAYADPDRLEVHMKALSPTDADEIASFVDGIRQLAQFDMSILATKPRSLMGVEDWIAFNRAVLPYALPMAKWGRLSARSFAERLRDPLLQAAFPLIFGWPDIPMMVGMSVLAYMSKQNAGFPQGGSLAFAERIAARYQALGGQIHYGAQVEKVLTENGRAVGVRLYNDEVHNADFVISAADGRGTLFDMLDGEFVDRRLRKQYDGNLPIHSQVQVSLGVQRDLSDTPHWTTHLLPEPSLIAGQSRSALGVKHYCFDPTLAPPGKSVVEVMLESDYAYWQRIYGRRLYDLEQIQVANIVLDLLEEIYPGLSDKIEVKDVATPLSYERYTGNWQGSTCGWLLTDQTMMLMVRGLPKQLPGLGHFYLAGQWVEPGGSLPLAAMSGRNAIQSICAQVDQPFRALAA